MSQKGDKKASKKPGSKRAIKDLSVSAHLNSKKLNKVIGGAIGKVDDPGGDGGGSMNHNETFVTED